MFRVPTRIVHMSSEGAIVGGGGVEWWWILRDVLHSSKLRIYRVSECYK